jgi:hypothetical protein
MKLFTFFMALMLGTTLLASSSDFSYDANEVNQSLSKLNQLEAMHKANPSASFEELTSNEVFAGTTISKATISSVAGNAADLPVLPAFWWGCILGVIGILIVYLVTEDTDQTKSALWGCIIGYVGGFLLYILFYVWILGNAALWGG